MTLGICILGFIFGWHFFCVQIIGIPLWTATWPLTIAAFAATFFTVNNWMKQERSWRRFGRQCAWIILPLLGTGLLIETQRVVAIPDVDPGFNWQEHEAELRRSNPSLTHQWQQFLSMPFGTLSPADREQWEEVAQALQQVMDRTERESNQRLNPQIFLTPVMPFDLERRLGNCLSLAKKLIEEGRLTESWEILMTNLSALEYLAPQWQLNVFWNRLTFCRDLTTDVIMQWAQHPDQTPELLKQAAEFLSQQPLGYPYEGMVKNQYVLIRQAIEHRDWGWIWVKEQSPQFEAAFPMSLVTRVEEWRALRLINQHTNAQLADRPSIEYSANSIDWFVTTPYAILWGWGTILSEPLPITEEAVRQQATRIVIALEQYRHKHGEYPESLSQLTEEFLESLPRDPSNGGDFHYEPHGLPHPLIDTRDHRLIVIPAGQPLLFSIGQVNAPYVFMKQLPTFLSKEISEQPDGITIDPNDVYWSNARILSPSPLHIQQERTDRVLFIQFFP